MHDARTTARAIATELGEAGERGLASVDPTPVGSGCIAQVHRAVGADGARLAVKVLHPGVEAVVGADLCLLRAAAWAVEALVPLPGLRWLALREAVDEFARFMAMQAPRSPRPSRALAAHRSLGPATLCGPPCTGALALQARAEPRAHTHTRTTPHCTAPHPSSRAGRMIAEIVRERVGGVCGPRPGQSRVHSSLREPADAWPPSPRRPVHRAHPTALY